MASNTVDISNKQKLNDMTLLAEGGAISKEVKEERDSVWLPENALPEEQRGHKDRTRPIRSALNEHTFTHPHFLLSLSTNMPADDTPNPPRGPICHLRDVYPIAEQSEQSFSSTLAQFESNLAEQSTVQATLGACERMWYGRGNNDLIGDNESVVEEEEEVGVKRVGDPVKSQPKEMQMYQSNRRDSFMSNISYVDEGHDDDEDDEDNEYKDDDDDTIRARTLHDFKSFGVMTHPSAGYQYPYSEHTHTQNHVSDDGYNWTSSGTEVTKGLETFERDRNDRIAWLVTQFEELGKTHEYSASEVFDLGGRSTIGGG